MSGRRHLAASASDAVDRLTAPSQAALAAWDELVCATPGTDVTQLSVWARVRRAEGFSPTYLFARQGSTLVGGVQLLHRRVAGLGHVAYAAHGPVIAAHADDPIDVADRLAGALVQLRGVHVLLFQPPEGGDAVRTALLTHGLRPSAAGIAPTGSVRLDLTRCEAEIARGFPPRLRAWTRRWPDHGVRVRVGGVDDVPVLEFLMRMTAESRGYARPPRLNYLRHLYEELSRTGNVAIFIGEVDGVPTSADLVTMCGDVVRGRLGGFDRSGPRARLSVPAAARWEIIRWGSSAGYRWLDFGGLSERTLHDAVDLGIRSCDSWPGTDRAKMQFGGVPYRCPSPVELIQPGPLRWSHDVAVRFEWGQAALGRLRRRMRSGARHRSALTSPTPAGPANGPL